MPKVTVLIRAKNEARQIGATLDAVLGQRGVEFDVLVLDSGSTDETVALAQKRGVRVETMPAEEFTYGRALNRGIAATDAPIVALLSAHARPLDRDWLANILAPLDDPAVAAVTGKQLPRPDCNPFDRRGLRRRYGLSRRYLHAGSAITHSNANAAIRRADWERERFDETLPYSEDLAWSLCMMANGRRIVYEPTAAAYHSHNETPAELFRRFHAESAARVAIGQAGSRYRLPRLAYDLVAGAAYDAITALARPADWRYIPHAFARRHAINIGRYCGSRGIPRVPGRRPTSQALSRVGLIAWDKLNATLQRLAPYVVRATRKHVSAIHPKHLLRDSQAHYWYGDYLTGGRLLDIGCNQGMHAIWAAKRMDEVVAFDQDRRVLEVAAFNSRWEGLRNVTLLRLSAEKSLPFADASFDVVLAFDVIEHLENRRAFLGEIRRLLKPGGTLLLSAPNADTQYKRWKKEAGLRFYCDPTHVIEYGDGELERECEEGGFACEARRPVVLDTPWYGVFDFLGGFSLPLYERFDQYKRDAMEYRPGDTTGYRVVLRPRPVEKAPGNRTSRKRPKRGEARART
ncbi:methyltransferase domain-containing protein [bacterium]|nr:methyltransferase domain-containing protein [bacterium]